MGVFDKIKDMMHLGDDDYDDYDDYDDDDDYDDQPRRSIFRKKEKDYDYDLEEDVKRKSDPKPQKATPRISPVRSKKGGSSMDVCVFKPTRFEDAREITETLLSNSTIVLNFEGLDVEIAQRIIDFTSGSCFAIGGNLQKVTNYIFVVTPKTVDISGDIQDILSGAFDIPNV